MYLSDKLKLDREYVEENQRILFETINHIESTSEDYRVLAKKRQDSLVKPSGSLGKLEEISIKLAGIYNRSGKGISAKHGIVCLRGPGLHHQGQTVGSCL